MTIKIVSTEKRECTFNESKCKSFSFEDVMFLTGAKYEPVIDDIQEYVTFATREEFLEQMNNYDIDTTKQVFVSDKGSFLCPIKKRVTISKSQEVNDESADSEEDKAE